MTNYDNSTNDDQRTGDTGQTDSEDMDNFDTQRSSDTGLEDNLE